MFRLSLRWHMAAPDCRLAVWQGQAGAEGRLHARLSLSVKCEVSAKCEIMSCYVDSRHTPFISLTGNIAYKKTTNEK